MRDIPLRVFRVLKKAINHQRTDTVTILCHIREPFGAFRPRHPLACHCKYIYILSWTNSMRRLKELQIQWKCFGLLYTFFPSQWWNSINKGIILLNKHILETPCNIIIKKHFDSIISLPCQNAGSGCIRPLSKGISTFTKLKWLHY